MCTTYHLTSAQDVDATILEAIKVIFKSKPITIIVEEQDENDLLSPELKAIIEERLQEDDTTYLTADSVLASLKNKFSV